MFPSLQPLHSGLSFLTPYIQELTVPHARVTPSFRYITLNRVDPLIQSLHLPLPAPLKFSNKVPVLPVTSFHTFFRTCSEHFFHSVTFSTAHKSICFISLHSPCLGADLVTFHSAFTLVFAIAPSEFGRTFNGPFLKWPFNLPDHAYKSSSFSVVLFKYGLSARCCCSGDKGKFVF